MDPYKHCPFTSDRFIINTYEDEIDKQNLRGKFVETYGGNFSYGTMIHPIKHNLLNQTAQDDYNLNQEANAYGQINP